MNPDESRDDLFRETESFDTFFPESLQFETWTKPELVYSKALLFYFRICAIVLDLKINSHSEWIWKATLTYINQSLARNPWSFVRKLNTLFALCFVFSFHVVSSYPVMKRSPLIFCVFRIFLFIYFLFLLFFFFLAMVSTGSPSRGGDAAVYALT